MTTPKEAIERADRAWRDGLLVEAHEGYQEALRLDPSSWHATFQLAWLDSAFGPIDPDRVRALEGIATSEDGAALMDLLRDRATPAWSHRPSGALRDWDVGSLRASVHASDPRWWENLARTCAEALPNVANACWEEAEQLDPGRYYKRPHAMLNAAHESEWHMDVFREIDTQRAAP